MAFRWTNTLKDKEVTDQSVFLNRRQIMAGAAGLGLVGLAGAAEAEELVPNTFEDISNYCNYYEFGTGK